MCPCNKTPWNPLILREVFSVSLSKFFSLLIPEVYGPDSQEVYAKGYVPCPGQSEVSPCPDSDAASLYCGGLRFKLLMQKSQDMGV